jgi:paired box protein 3/7
MKRTSVSRSFSLFPAAVDYLAKNVSLSTQRRMKLGEHSAVLGLLPVETGQAY